MWHSWNPFNRHKIDPVLVPDVEPASIELRPEVEAASMRSLARREDVKVLVRSIHDQLAAGALLQIQGNRQ